MAISRRKFLVTGLAGSAVAMVGGAELVSGLTNSASAASPAGDVVGKITVGYQGWFACIGDGAPINGWWHWSQNMASAPSPSNTNIKAWPDMADYTATYKTAFANFNNRQPATLFSSYDQQTVNTHFSWMQQNGCDTAALQRFNPTGGEGPTRDAMAVKVRSAAEAYDRKFYIMYDVSGWTTMQADIKADWTDKMSSYTSSSAYAHQNGKTSATQATVPANSGLLALDEDGKACSTDYYLRLTNDGGRMLKGEIALTATRPTPPVPSTTTGTPTATATASCGVLAANQTFPVDQPVLSCDGRLKLVLGGDGNLVLYQGAAALWAANTSGKGGTVAYMQGDGNFVLYNAKGGPVWSSGTAGNDGATLSVQDDGNVVIYSSAGQALWSTGTAGH